MTSMLLNKIRAEGSTLLSCVGCEGLINLVDYKRKRVRVIQGVRQDRYAGLQ